MRILLTTEGTYPYTRGGVSTWAHSLVSGLPHHRFIVLAVTANPVRHPRYRVPSNVEVVEVPLWGSEGIEEYLDRPSGLRRRARTTSRVVVGRFLPVLEALVGELLVAKADLDAIGEHLVALADLSEIYDLSKAMHDEVVWSLLLERFSSNPLYGRTGLDQAMDLARSLYRYLTPLAAPLPDVDLVHSSAAALCALPALVMKRRSGTPYLLTEHGIYLRERILDLVRNQNPTLEKVLLSNLFRGVVRSAYKSADHLLPVCAYNARWEEALGVDAARVTVIHNGVDPRRFVPGDAEVSRPTVAFVGRIDPLKDVLALVRAARLVRERLPDVVFRVYGPDSDPAYAQRCRSAVAALGLDGCVVFEGPVDDVARAYRDCHVFALPSMSEGFPFSLIEAMMSARPVVSTGVGGVPEALGGLSRTVEPQNAPALAGGLIELLERPERERAAMGEALRERASTMFTREQFLSRYDALYSGCSRIHDAA